MENETDPDYNRRRLRRRRGYRSACVTEYGPRGDGFSDRVKGVQFAIADAAENSDHLVSPQETARIRMARQ